MKAVPLMNTFKLQERYCRLHRKDDGQKSYFQE